MEKAFDAGSARLQLPREKEPGRLLAVVMLMLFVLVELAWLGGLLLALVWLIGLI